MSTSDKETFFVNGTLKTINELLPFADLIRKLCHPSTFGNLTQTWQALEMAADGADPWACAALGGFFCLQYRGVAAQWLWISAAKSPASSTPRSILSSEESPFSAQPHQGFRRQIFSRFLTGLAGRHVTDGV